MIHIPNTTTEMSCYDWMQYFFSLVADQAPNADYELHLELCEKKAIWEEYEFDAKVNNEKVLGLREFYKLWHLCLPHVKIRVYKNVTGNQISICFLC